MYASVTTWLDQKTGAPVYVEAVPKNGDRTEGVRLLQHRADRRRMALAPGRSQSRGQTRLLDAADRTRLAARPSAAQRFQSHRPFWTHRERHRPMILLFTISSTLLAIPAALVALLALLVLSGFLYQWIGSLIDRKRLLAPGRLIDIGEGRRLYLVEKGPAGRGPSVVFESGFAATSLNWLHIQDAVAEHIHTVAYDRCGLGWSSAPISERTPTQVAAELRSHAARCRNPAAVDSGRPLLRRPRHAALRARLPRGNRGRAACSIPCAPTSGRR